MSEETRMNVEERRLRTFRNWPRNAAVEPTRIAAAGFYSVGSDLRVKCYSCGCEINYWEYGDQVMTRHIALNPECAFVRDPERAGNVPLIVERPAMSPSQRNGRESPPVRAATIGRWESQSSVYKSEQARLDSFADWPIPFIVRPEALAATGFYFMGQGDKVQCAFCTGIINRWEAGDVPKEEHKRHFPNCPFLIGFPVGNVPRTPGTNSCDSLRLQGRLSELGVQTYRGPRVLAFSTVESRLRTFDDWPSDLSQRPADLAQAGFYYKDLGNPPDSTRDQVRCFHCDGGLRNWEPEDDPWREHARWFPTCHFLLLVKGKPFVDEVQTYYRTSADRAQTTSRENTRSPPHSLPSSSGLSTSMPSLSVSGDDGEASSSAAAAVSDPETLAEENRQLRDARNCKICMDAEIGTIFLPCGHIVACVGCAPSLLDCPVCRVTIKATVRAFLT